MVVLSTLDDALAGSALFGHIAGAFTDARQPRTGGFLSAQHGTLFLDELGKCSLAVQQKLLHVIETGEFQPMGSDRVVRVDMRIIAATNVSLEELVLEGRFLSDLLARIEAFSVRIPALRERRVDIPHLAAAVVEGKFRDCGYDAPPAISKELMAVFVRAPWPHNLRELDTTIHRVMLQPRGALCVSVEHWRAAFPKRAASLAPRRPITASLVRQTIEVAGTVSAAAKILGANPSTLYRHLRADLHAAASAHPGDARS